jgi:hypothetical protein
VAETRKNSGVSRGFSPRFDEIRHNGQMSEVSGKHSGARRAEPTARPPRSRTLLLLLSLGAVLSVMAWAYLVRAAIAFGRTARIGDTSAWAFLVIASIGGIACLFTALMFAVRLVKTLNPPFLQPQLPTVPGGRRAKR